MVDEVYSKQLRGLVDNYIQTGEFMDLLKIENFTNFLKKGNCKANLLENQSFNPQIISSQWNTRE